MALVVFGFTYLIAAVSYGLVSVLAMGERARSFKAVSPGMLPPLGIIFGLFVAFTAAQVWSDNERASAGVSREASALIASILRNALERSTICSNDPVCADHEPDDRSGDRATHGAAYHGCLLIAETSCEMRNLFLDRNLLVPTMAASGAAFFGKLPYSQAA